MVSPQWLRLLTRSWGATGAGLFCLLLPTPGLYLTDILLNFESMYKPLLRLALMLMSLGLTLGIEFAAAARNPLQ